MIQKIEKIKSETKKDSVKGGFQVFCLHAKYSHLIVSQLTKHKTLSLS